MRALGKRVNSQGFRGFESLPLRHFPVLNQRVIFPDSRFGRLPAKLVIKQENPYVISEFTNPSGKIVFQVYARIDGKRFRKNFPTRAEAERQILGIQYLQETEMRVATTRLAACEQGEVDAIRVHHRAD